MDAVETAAAAGEIVAVAVTGKPFVFAVGADLSGIPHLADLAQARQLGELGHATFRRLGELPVPSFAFVNGAAMGGGLEVALHCTYRTVSTGAGRLALPEVALGLVPGWGGAYLVPNLIGAEKAIKVIIENPLTQNRMLKPGEVLSLGLADVSFEPADFLVESLRWAASVLAGGDRRAAPEGRHGCSVGRGGGGRPRVRRREGRTAPRRRPTAPWSSSTRPGRRPATRASRPRTPRSRSS